LGQTELELFKTSQQAVITHTATTLSGVLMQLLPDPDDDRKRPELVQMLIRIFENAVKLANLMTTERGFFRCIVPDSGEEYSDQTACARDVGTGRILMCTFPGFCRLNRPENGPDTIMLAKPSVELECLVRALHPEETK
jgi:hypothetical protein